MTRLANITTNHLSLTCDLCGHNALLPVTAAIEVFGREATMQHVTSRARCTRCKVKGHNTVQIIYIGEGWHALEGARG